MKNMRDGFVLVVSCLLVVVSLIGCGQQETTTTTTTTLPISGVVSISGKLSTGVVASSAGAKAQAVAYAAISDYTVAAVSKDTGMVYFADAKTGSDGSFTVSKLPSGESFYLEVLDNTNKLAAPVSMGSSEGKPVMAIAPASTTTDLGNILYDSNAGAAAPVTEPTAILDKGTSAEAKSGETLVPVGAKNFGKGDEAKFSGTYDPDKADGDKDGLPNFFDADNNGDGVVDEIDGLYTREAFIPGAIPNFFTYVFSNLKIDYDHRDTFNTGPNAYQQFDIAVGVTSNAGKGGSPSKTISSVKVIDGPTWITKATVSGGGLWSANGYDVPSKEGNVFEVHLGGLKPVTDVNTGDTLKFRIIYSDGASEEAMKMINFVFSDIPRVTAYKIGSGGSWKTSLPLSGALDTAATSEVYLKWTRPKDETSKEIIGGKYTFEYNAKPSGVREVEVLKDPGPSVTTLEGGYNLGTLSDADFSAIEFMVGLCIRSLANDNAAENVRFTKNW